MKKILLQTSLKMLKTWPLIINCLFSFFYKTNWRDLPQILCVGHQQIMLLYISCLNNTIEIFHRILTLSIEYSHYQFSNNTKDIFHRILPLKSIQSCRVPFSRGLHVWHFGVWFYVSFINSFKVSKSKKTWKSNFQQKQGEKSCFPIKYSSLCFVKWPFTTCFNKNLLNSYSGKLNHNM